MPLKYLLGPVGDMYCLSNTFRMLVYVSFVVVFGVYAFVNIIIMAKIERKLELNL